MDTTAEQEQLQVPKALQVRVCTRFFVLSFRCAVSGRVSRRFLASFEADFRLKFAGVRLTFRRLGPDLAPDRTALTRKAAIRAMIA